jgi:peptidoglycan/xylan/chitin deacetylase (PgdA/CDA1 family)
MTEMSASLMRIPLALRAPAGQRGRLSIMIFHRVLAEADPLSPDEPDAATFELRMRWVRQWFNVLPLRDAVRRLYDGTLPSRALSITFDDGYADNEAIAAPVLRRLGMTATFFVSTGYVGTGCMWNDRVIEAVRAAPAGVLPLATIGLRDMPVDSTAQRREAVRELLIQIKHRPPEARALAVDAVVAAAGLAGAPAPTPMMTIDQVRSLRALGMDVGAHTVSHPILARLEPAAAAREIGEGRRHLEDMLGERIPLFAYPNGVPTQDYGPDHVRMVREAGFDAAVSTAWGVANRQADRHQLPRFTPWDRSRWRYALRMWRNLGEADRVVA